MANRYFVNGGVDNNWGSTSNWSTTSGGAGGSSVPTSSDAVFLDGNSPNCTVNTSNRVCLSLNCTGYTNTLTMTMQITASGSVTLASGMTIAGSGTLAINATGTMTSNGKTWPNNLTITGSPQTLADNWNVTGLVSVTNTVTLNSFQITCNGGFTMGAASISGTTKFVFAGGTITGHTANSIANPIDFAGNITFPSGGTLTLAAGTYTYVSGTPTFAGGYTLRIVGAATLNLAGLTWKDVLVIYGTSFTVTLDSNLQLSGLFTIGSSNLTGTINGFAVECPAGLRFGQTSGAVAGTTELRMTDTGTLDAPSITTGICTAPIVIDAPTGDITISDTALRVQLGKFIVRNAGSITTSEEWNLGGGGALNPLTSIYGKV